MSSKSTLIFVFLSLATLAMSAYPQVRKCVSADGRVTYSDFVCPTTAKESDVTVNANTIDGAHMRDQAKAVRTEEAVSRAMQQNAGKCKFSSYVYGDSQGRVLADAAKEECLNNIAAAASGKPTSLEAYNMWKDHSTQKQASRQAALTRAENSANARATIGAINSLNNKIDSKEYKCKPNRLGSELNCQ